MEYETDIDIEYKAGGICEQTNHSVRLFFFPGKPIITLIFDKISEFSICVGSISG
jgi:hypothetical protein